MASSRAFEIPSLSSSSAGTQPRPVAEDSRILAFRASCFLVVSFLESFRSLNQSSSSLGKTTAPTTSGPARGPRPTSSMPRIGIRLT